MKKKIAILGGFVLLLVMMSNLIIHNTSKKTTTTIALKNVEALACTFFEDFGAQGALWCNCDNLKNVCGVRGDNGVVETVYGRPEVRW